MLTCEYINQLKQLGYEQYDLCIMDGETCVVRFQKAFHAGVTQEIMDEYAAIVVAQVEAAMALAAQGGE